MLHTKSVVLAGLTAAIVGVGGVAAYGASQTHAPSVEKTRTLTVVEHAVTDTTADTGPTGDSLGDVLAFANPIFDQADHKRVGSDNGSCVRTAVGKAYDCQWSVSLAGGQIMVQGPFYDSRDSHLAITGGTGSFDGASGWMLLHARDAAGSAYDFTYHFTS